MLQAALVTVSLVVLSTMARSNALKAEEPAEPFDLGDTVRQIESLQESGKLEQADALVRQVLETQRSRLTARQQRQLEYEFERSRRIRKDYPLSCDALMTSLTQGVKDFAIDEFERWESAGRFDVKQIDGQKRYFESSRSNLFFRYPDINARRMPPPNRDFEKRRLAHVRDVKAAYARRGQFLGLPLRRRLQMTISVKAGIVPEGQTIRCWMPYPQQFSAQSGVQLLSSEPAVKWIDREDAPMRSLYFEAPSAGAAPTLFRAEYLQTGFARYQPVDAGRIDTAATTQWPQYTYFIRQQPPHVVFDEKIRNLAEKIAEGESNPYLRARRYYDWISRNTKYSYAREYSTLHNISRYVLEQRYGDCGQHALLFISLCRAGGVPARWQSGWTVRPTRVGLHDWAEIFVEPYGWLPVDVDYAVAITHDYQLLNSQEKQELIDFYFGGIDAHRLIINREHGMPLYPPKTFPRSDDVDFQRGELETDEGNLYFDQFDYRLQMTELPGPDRSPR